MNNESKMAEVVIAIHPIAPSSSPHMRERFAPSICAEVPIASPFAALLCIPSNFKSFGPNITEKIPENNTKKTVKAVVPPKPSDTVKATGSVTERGIRDAMVS